MRPRSPWTAKRPGGRLTFSQVMPSGRPGKTVDQPWVPLIMARLPVWPVPFIGEPDPQQGAPAAPASASAPLALLGLRPAKNQPTRPPASAPLAPLTIRAAKNQPHRPPAAESVAAR